MNKRYLVMLAVCLLTAGLVSSAGAAGLQGIGNTFPNDVAKNESFAKVQPRTFVATGIAPQEIYLAHVIPRSDTAKGILPEKVRGAEVAKSMKAQEPLYGFFGNMVGSSEGSHEYYGVAPAWEE